MLGANDVGAVSRAWILLFLVFCNNNLTLSYLIKWLY